MDLRRARISDPDEWLATAPDFSRPIASELREWIFRTAPDLTESIKWNNLCFSGRKLVCGLAACQRHVGLFFARGTELPDPAGLFERGEGNVSIRSLRVVDPARLERRALAALLRAAVALDAAQIPPPPRQKRPTPELPDFFAKALARRENRRAAEGYRRLPPSCQREYITWVGGAKLEATRERRLAETLAALAAGRRWIDRKRV